jgi:hypothetical protein
MVLWNVNLENTRFFEGRMKEFKTSRDFSENKRTRNFRDAKAPRGAKRDHDFRAKKNYDKKKNYD